MKNPHYTWDKTLKLRKTGHEIPLDNIHTIGVLKGEKNRQKDIFLNND